MLLHGVIQTRRHDGVRDGTVTRGGGPHVML